MGMQETYNEVAASPEALLSVEFFPPKNEKMAQKLMDAAARIKCFDPNFASVTYGAGGSTRESTIEYANRLAHAYRFNVMPHLTCVGHSRQELVDTILKYKSMGIQKIMALRGDPPKGDQNFKPHPDGLSYANELVELIKSVHPTAEIGVAAYPETHPEASSAEADLLHLKRKVDAGADFMITQLFFDNAVYFKFVQKCRSIGINIPILPGLMTVQSREQAHRFCELCGSQLPAKLDEQLRQAEKHRERVRQVSEEWTYQQARGLLKGHAPGIHLYVLNNASPMQNLMQALQADGFYLKRSTANNDHVGSH
jgi:methylenetetrahydrofolate reductase (NADPH)